jgi:hypothetical protein
MLILQLSVEGAVQDGGEEGGELGGGFGLEAAQGGYLRTHLPRDNLGFARW